eukprot:TRINITY_DN3613_c0_g1_i2.p1 TRINITY_DN3613_c0_g1~~TRINITY_DN3613_c0_g1_i2.p1  ORF type:complete len:465 (-),score=87.86 TRINITY_DN3613_c0_g1_i2:799-2193(-)
MGEPPTQPLVRAKRRLSETEDYDDGPPSDYPSSSGVDPSSGLSTIPIAASQMLDDILGGLPEDQLVGDTGFDTEFENAIRRFIQDTEEILPSEFSFVPGSLPVPEPVFPAPAPPPTSLAAAFCLDEDPRQRREGPNFYSAQSQSRAPLPGDKRARLVAGLRYYFGATGRGTQVSISSARAVQKSYGTERRYLCPPPTVVLTDSVVYNLQRDNLQVHILVADDKLTESPSISDAVRGLLSGTVMFKRTHFKEDSQFVATFDVEICDFAGRLLGPFRSHSIAILPKPKKASRTTAHNSSLSILAGSSVALFNRLGSQSNSTRYISISPGGAIRAVPSQWTAMKINLAPGSPVFEPPQTKRPSVAMTDDGTSVGGSSVASSFLQRFQNLPFDRANPAPALVSGMRVTLSVTNSAMNFVTPELELVRVDRASGKTHFSILPPRERVSQLQRIALRYPGSPMFLGVVKG